MDYELVWDYKENDMYRRSFNDLANKVFGVDFEQWYQYGCWNNNYICYSFIFNGSIISNVSVNKLNLVKNGLRINAVQIGTVMTEPNYQNNGLGTKLLKYVLEEYNDKSELIFLFRDKGAAGFYKKFDFEIINEWKFYIDNYLYRKRTLKCRKMDITNEKDINILINLAENKFLLSNDFGVENAEHILTWHMINVFPNDIYYFEEINLVLIYREEEDVFNIFDIVTDRVFDIKLILENIVSDKINKINFLFTPNSDNIELKNELNITDEYDFYIKSDVLDMGGKFYYPYTSHA